MNAISTIAQLTFREAWRRRIALAALLLGVAFLVLYNVGFYFIHTEIESQMANSSPGTMIEAQGVRNTMFNFFSTAGLYAVNFLTLAMGAMLSADTLAGEITSGTVQALVTKPIRRTAIVLGKWLGFSILLALYLLLMGGGVLISVWVQTGYILTKPLNGLGLIYLTSLLVMTMTLMLSSRLSALATGGTVFGLYGLAFIGGWVEQIGAALQNRTAVEVGIVSSLIFPSEALWKRAAYEISSPLLQAVAGFTPFTASSPPSALMLVYAVLYLLVSLWLATRWFKQRDL
ncbi:MAG: ABC transporter permease subunit [Anaerolineales bacterium]|nr:ABC transporter permease subunit [Anaerolineales bacterium]